MKTLSEAFAADAVTLQIHDRVALKSDATKLGIVISFTSERRVVVKWDQSEPKVATFCGYCLENFRLEPGKAKAMSDVLLNSRNGQAFHFECAKAIAITVAMRERDLKSGPFAEAPPVDAEFEDVKE
jgi:hypothetical protein